MILLVFGFLVASLPPFIGYAASVITVMDLRSQRFELLHMTTISDADLVRGYITSALYRSRALFSLVIALLPTVIILTVYVVSFESYERCTSSAAYSSCFLAVVPQSLFSVLAVFLGAGMNGIILCLLSAALGVLFAGLWRNRFFSSGAAVISSLILVGIFVAASLSINIADTLRAYVSYFPAVFVLCIAAISAARPFVRKSGR